MTENELTYWKSTRALGLGLFLARRFIIPALGLVVVGSIDVFSNMLSSTKPLTTEMLALKFLYGLGLTTFYLIYEGYRWSDAGRQLKGHRPLGLEPALIALFSGVVLLASASVFRGFRFPEDWTIGGVPGNIVLALGCGVPGVLLLAGSIFWGGMKTMVVLKAPVPDTSTK